MRGVPVDVNEQFPAATRARIAQNLADLRTPEGAAVARPLRSIMRPMSVDVAPVSKVATRAIIQNASSLTFSAQTGELWNSPKLRYMSGTPTPVDAGNAALGALSKTTGAENVTGMHLAFVLEGDRVAVMFQTFGVVDVQIYVDGQPLWATPQTTPGAGYFFADVQLAVAGTYEVVVVLGNAVFIQVVHNLSHSIAPALRRYTLGLFGDSYADAGQAPYFGGLAAELMARTGFGIVHFGQGSTGWAAQLDDPNTLGKSPYESGDRRAAVAAQDIDALLVLGSINSGAQAPAVVAAALEAFDDGLQTDNPGLPVFVAGVEPYNLGTNPAQVANNDALRDKAAELGLPFIDWFGEEWMTGTGSTAAPNGTGTQDRLVGADTIHLSLAGNRFMAQRFADALGAIPAAV